MRAIPKAERERGLAIVDRGSTPLEAGGAATARPERKRLGRHCSTWNIQSDTGSPAEPAARDLQAEPERAAKRESAHVAQPLRATRESAPKLDHRPQERARSAQPSCSPGGASGFALTGFGMSFPGFAATVLQERDRVVGSRPGRAFDKEDIPLLLQEPVFSYQTIGEHARVADH